MRSKIRWFPWWLLAACGTETGNPEGLVEVGYNARSTSPDVAIAADGRARVDAAWLRLETTRIDLCDADPVTVDGIGLGDHSGPDPAWQQLRAPLVDACGLGVVAADGDPAIDPDGVDGAAIAVIGALADGRELVVRWRGEVDLDVAFDPEPLDSDASWLLSFDLGVWIDPAALEAAAGDPVIVDGDPAALRAGLTLHEDVGRDGQVDPAYRRIDIP